MKPFTIILMSILWATHAFAQIKTPEFEFTLYGEDARGHKDSVVIAYDRKTKYENFLETEFGDVSIANKKLDSVFEMRVHKSQYVYGILDQVIARGHIAKHITLKYGFTRIFPPPDEPCVPYGVSQNGFILCKVKYLPIKFTWDKSRFSDRKSVV